VPSNTGPSPTKSARPSFEPASTLNTGNVQNERTVAHWTASERGFDGETQRKNRDGRVVGEDDL